MEQITPFPGVSQARSWNASGSSERLGAPRAASEDPTAKVPLKKLARTSGPGDGSTLGEGTRRPAPNRAPVHGETAEARAMGSPRPWGRSGGPSGAPGRVTAPSATRAEGRAAAGWSEEAGGAHGGGRACRAGLVLVGADLVEAARFDFEEEARVAHPHRHHGPAVGHTGLMSRTMARSSSASSGSCVAASRSSIRPSPTWFVLSHAEIAFP